MKFLITLILCQAFSVLAFDSQELASCESAALKKFWWEDENEARWECYENFRESMTPNDCNKLTDRLRLRFWEYEERNLMRNQCLTDLIGEMTLGECSETASKMYGHDAQNEGARKCFKYLDKGYFKKATIKECNNLVDSLRLGLLEHEERNSKYQKCLNLFIEKK